MRLLAVTGIADGGNLPTDFPLSLLPGSPLDAVGYLTRLLLGVGHMTGVALIRAVPLFHLLEQGPHTLLYVGVGRGAEPLGVGAPLDSAARGTGADGRPVHIEVLGQLYLATLHEYPDKSGKDDLDMGHAAGLEPADGRVVGELVRR